MVIIFGAVLTRTEDVTLGNCHAGIYRANIPGCTGRVIWEFYKAIIKRANSYTTVHMRTSCRWRCCFDRKPQMGQQEKTSRLTSQNSHQGERGMVFTCQAPLHPGSRLPQSRDVREGQRAAGGVRYREVGGTLSLHSVASTALILLRLTVP
jgi:hypothetical protein